MIVTPVTDPSHSGRSAAGDPTKNPSALPKHILTGYWHNWHAHPAAFLPLREVIAHFDVINVAFATGADTGDGEVTFAPCLDAKEFAADTLYLQRLGKKVLLSIGGATGSIAIDSVAAQDNFSDSVSRIVQQYGFDGIDINLEGKIRLDPGDTDFRNPTSASIRHLTGAIREIRNNFGPDFILSMAPEAVNVQGALGSYEDFSGSYLPVIYELRDILTYLQVQHYNSGALPMRDGSTHRPGTADFHVALAEMLLQGFAVRGDPELVFPPLRPDQLVVGLAAWPDAVHGGYTEPLEATKVLSYLITGKSFAGTRHLYNCASYESLRGVMIWSINWDAAHHRQFSNAIRFFLDTLP